MKCPHCRVGVRFEFSWSNKKPLTENNDFTFGEDFIALGHAYCPECGGYVLLATKSYEEPGPVIDEDLLIRSQEWLYPRSVNATEEVPDEIPPDLKSDFLEAVACLDVSAKASAAISRRILQHVLREHANVKGKNLETEIDKFIQQPSTPSHIADALHGVRHVGNFAAHPIRSNVTGEVLPVEPGEAEWLIETLRALFDFIFVQPSRIERRREELNRKLQEAGKPLIPSSNNTAATEVDR